MEKNVENISMKADFSEIVKKTYDKAMQEKEISLNQLIEDLKEDLRHLVAL
ncbi:MULTISPECIES: hypothetical protein [Neobacillus]|uniref:Uncharacterized protein n=1 Tax=Neobacillus rhizophilus TaxID=2833579 RepID=A0A942U592_9BACI|nr:hypothetical protein [Neobacillus rhizophilus]MBS4212672.1 hypothetical protein [Neobacillus rhizophilus]MBU8915079.1 hypothetical protein [Bacillus sp. FJAT-29953]